METYGEGTYMEWGHIGKGHKWSRDKYGEGSYTDKWSGDTHGVGTHMEWGYT